MIVEASLATYPPRAEVLRSTVAQLAKQVDRVHVYANGYADSSPDLAWIEGYDNVVLHAGNDCAGDLGDVGKFWRSGDAGTVQLHCDDDIVYPDDYAERMVQAVERTNRKAVVGVHGVLLLKPFWSYFRDRDVRHFAAHLHRDTGCHLLGTGTIAYPGELLSVTIDDFPTRNMADIYFARLCQRRKIPMVAVRRRQHWLRPAEGVRGTTIYQRSKEQAAKGNDIVSLTLRGEQNWRVFPVPPREERKA